MKHVRVLTLSLLSLISPISAFADAVQSQRWFSGLSTDQRADLQGNLVLLAHYGGMVDGQFGSGTYNALAGWQQSLGADPTGVLNDEQMSVLGQMASEVMSQMGMSLVDDLGGHLSIMLPTGLLTLQRDRVNGTWYQDAAGQIDVETFWRTSHSGTLAQNYARALTPHASKSVSYSTLREDLFVVTGIENGRYYYELAHADGAATAGFRFTYSEEYREIGGVASVFAASYSTPINVIEKARQATPAPAPTTGLPITSTVEPQTGVPNALPKSTKSKSADDGINSFGNFFTMDDAPGVLALIGDIGPSTPLEFRRALRSVAQPDTLVLASNGGSVASALMVAYEVHELGLDTYILPEAGCYSACSFIFVAGKERLALGELGVHQVWGEQADASSAQTVVSDILEAFSEFGVRQEVTSAMLRTVPDDMYVFDAVELEQWGLNTPQGN